MKHWFISTETTWAADDDLQKALALVKKATGKVWTPEQAFIYLVPGSCDNTEYAIDHYRPVGVGAFLIGRVKHLEDA